MERNAIGGQKMDMSWIIIAQKLGLIYQSGIGKVWMEADQRLLSGILC